MVSVVALMKDALPDSTTFTLRPMRCLFFGHRYRFRADGATMSWACERCGEPGGSKEYGTAEEAGRFARAFDREDRSDLGRRAPLVAVLPLRLWRMWRDRR
jgi:hypothetical protein